MEELRKMVDAEEIVKLKNKPKKFILVIESWGQLTPSEMLNNAFAEVEANLKELKLK